MLSVAIHGLLAGWLVLSTWGASILQLHKGSSSSRSMSPASLPSAEEPSCDTSFSIGQDNSPPRMSLQLMAGPFVSNCGLGTLLKGT